jgi:hypothetical protein
MSDPVFSAMSTKERQPWKDQKPKLNRGRPNSVLRARRKLQGDFDTIDQDETAAILGKSTKTLQRYRALKYGPSFKIEDGYVSYSRAEVLAWKAEHNFRRTPSKVLRRVG